jgi:hypothetical protein
MWKEGDFWSVAIFTGGCGLGSPLSNREIIRVIYDEELRRCKW